MIDIIRLVTFLGLLLFSLWTGFTLGYAIARDHNNIQKELEQYKKLYEEGGER